MQSTRRSAIFAKQPVPGQVKTRLAPLIGSQGAAELQAAMLEDLVTLHAAADCPLELAVHPPEALEAMAADYPRASRVEAQRGEDLGERLGAWFAAGPAGATQVVVGADCPFVDPDLVARAHELLEAGADAVFAPDGGGGYCLVGLAQPVPGLFESVPVSTEDNLACTLDELLQRGLQVELLPTHRDVDLPRDLERLMRDLNSARRRGDAHYPARTAEALGRLLEPACTDAR